MEAVSRITSKYQATIPAEVRAALGLKKGDAVKFEIRNGKVTLSKATPVDVAFARSLEGTLSEWHSEADEEAYRGL